MIDAAQNMRDTKSHEAKRRFVPRRIKGHAAGSAGDHHRPTSFAERDEAKSKRRVIAKISGDCSLYRKDRFGRGDRVDEMGVQITQLIRNNGVGGNGSATRATALP